MNELIERLEVQAVEIARLNTMLSQAIQREILLEQQVSSARDVLQVMTLKPVIVKYLMDNDPKLLEQAKTCLL